MRAWEFAFDGWEAMLVGSGIESDSGELCFRRRGGSADRSNSGVIVYLFPYLEIFKQRYQGHETHRSLSTLIKPILESMNPGNTKH